MSADSASWRMPAVDADREAWCLVTEGMWTWFGSVMLTLSLLVVFNLKYYRKVVSNPANLKKHRNEKVLRSYLLAHQKGLGTDPPSGSLSIEEFKACCHERRKQSIIFKIEFSTLIKTDGKDLAKKAANLEENKAKNRTEDLLPYDANRVVLRRTGRSSGSSSDYINASYCSGLLPGTKYIVTQGPLDRSVSDFWQLIWQEDVPVIAMLTKTFDLIKIMCTQYWPNPGDNEANQAGIRVTTLSETRFANFVHRVFRVRNGADERLIDQFQYTEWSCYGVPVKGTLLEYRRRVAVAMENAKLKGPCLIHCDDGGGRSGVFLVLDANIRLIEKENRVNVYSHLQKLLLEREGIITKQEQYSLIYSLIESYLNNGTTIRSTREFQSWSSRSEEKKKQMAISSEFTSFAQELGPISVRIVPPDSHRPYITSFQGNDCTDYINAVFVDGFLKPNEFIVTEWPLARTIPDFWSMVYDHDVSTIVVLTEPDKVGQGSRYPAIWPAAGKMSNYGPVFTVSRNSEANVEEHVSLRGFRSILLHLSKKELAPHRKTQALHVDDNQGKQLATLTSLVIGVTSPPRSCKLFQINSWPTGINLWPTGKQWIIDNVLQGFFKMTLLPSLPDQPVSSKATGLLSILRESRDWLQEVGPDHPVLVVSCDGAARAGLYCAVSYLADQVNREGQLDIVSAVTTVKANRPELVGSQQEYALLYQLVDQLLE